MGVVKVEVLGGCSENTFYIVQVMNVELYKIVNIINILFIV